LRRQTRSKGFSNEKGDLGILRRARSLGSRGASGGAVPLPLNSQRSLRRSGRVSAFSREVANALFRGGAGLSISSGLVGGGGRGRGGWGGGGRGGGGGCGGGGGGQLSVWLKFYGASKQSRSLTEPLQKENSETLQSFTLNWSRWLRVHCIYRCFPRKPIATRLMQQVRRASLA